MVQIHICEAPGDILVFLTGEEEIEDACKKITKEVAQAGDQVNTVLLCDVVSVQQHQLLLANVCSIAY